MYKDYFGLRETPFSIAPDPRYLYMSENHREALAHLLYGLNSEGGFVLLTGEVGTGKTTVCRCLLEQIPEDCETAFILNPRLTVVELLSSICDELHIRCPDGNTSIKVFVDLINARLLDTHARGSRTVLIIDEAQNLDTDVLEQLRLLTNLETNQRKLLQIILLGQPELRDKLALPELRQFAQRIIARYHLEPLTGQDVLSYVNHRLMVAGARTELFDPFSVRELYRVSGGIPRLINLVCDRALLGAYAEGKTRVDRDTLKKAAGELLGGRSSRSTHRSAYRLVAACLLFMVCGAALSAVYVQRFRPASAPAQPVVQEKASSSGMQRRQVPSSVKPAQAGEAVDASAAERGSAPAVVPRPSGSLRQLADSPLSRGDHAAFQALFARWGISLQAQENVPACRQAEAQGLRCLSGQGGMDELYKLNRPAVLKLHTNSGEEFYALLSVLQGDTAAFAAGSQSVTVPVSDIPKWWRGEYVLLWRPPPRYQGSVQGGDRGPLVDWLRSNLPAFKETRPVEGGVFDSAMVEAVIRFQLANGLKPDGIVGPHTLICLDTLIGTGSPLLVVRQEVGP